MLVTNVDIPKTWILNDISHIMFACRLMVRWINVTEPGGSYGSGIIRLDKGLQKACIW